jgi:hypothetical protein
MVASPTATATAELVRPLTELGFQKRSGGLLTLPLTEDVLGWIGLNTASRRPDRLVAFNPVIGLRHQAVEELVARLHQEKPHRYLPPTVSISLGYLMPDRQFRQWYFGPDTDPEPVVRDLVAAVQRYALPFMVEHQTLSGIAELLEQGMVPVPEQRAERAVTAALLAGRPERAEQELVAILERVGERTDPAAERIRTFAAAARTWSATGGQPD